jgi:hypothetical protein
MISTSGHVDEHFGHGEALLLSAAEGVHGLLEIAQAELEKEALHAGLVVPGVQLGHLFDGAVEGVSVEVLRHGVLVGADGVGNGIVAVQHFVHQAVGRGHLHVLVEVTDAQALVEADDARVRRFQPGDAFQQCALAGAVAGHDGGLLAFFKSEGNVLEKLARAIALTDALNGKAVHGEGPICGARRYVGRQGAEKVHHGGTEAQRNTESFWTRRRRPCSAEAATPRRGRGEEDLNHRGTEAQRNTEGLGFEPQATSHKL